VQTTGQNILNVALYLYCIERFDVGLIDRNVLRIMQVPIYLVLHPQGLQYAAVCCIQRVMWTWNVDCVKQCG